jgi:uracil phosphoribosyltransferase
MKSPILSGKKLVLAPIVRAGMGFLEGMLNLLPSARVAHIGLYRDPKTLAAVEYYFKAPPDVAERMVIVLDPMLATANSASKGSSIRLNPCAANAPRSASWIPWNSFGDWIC